MFAGFSLKLKNSARWAVDGGCPDGARGAGADTVPELLCVADPVACDSMSAPRSCGRTARLEMRVRKT
jgi:hypothetical protein